MSHPDWKSIAKGLVAYWVITVPVYLPWHFTFPQPLGVVMSWLPYIAAFVAGLVFAHVSVPNRDRDCVVLGAVIGVSLGIFNLAAPAIGFHSDLPGLKFSFVIAAIWSLIAVFLVLAGAGVKGAIHGSKKHT